MVIVIARGANILVIDRTVASGTSQPHSIAITMRGGRRVRATASGGNFIEKMMDDVSKAMSVPCGAATATATVITTRTTTTTPNDNILSKRDRRDDTLIVSGTAVRAVASQCRRAPPDAAAVGAESQSKAEENKCLREERCEVSYHSEFEANACGAIVTTSTWVTKSCDWCSAGPRATERRKRSTLAERNAKLKSDFLNAAAVSSTDVRRRRSQFGNLRLRIPSSIPEGERATGAVEGGIVAVLNGSDDNDEEAQLSLVVRRKRDLERKLAAANWSRSKDTTLSVPVSVPVSVAAWPSVKQLRFKFDKDHRHHHQPPSIVAKMMIVNADKCSDGDENAKVDALMLKAETHEQRHSPLSDEGCTLGQSPYSSDDNEDNASVCTASTTVERKRRDKVARTASSDSALGLDVDDPLLDAPATPPSPRSHGQRRFTLTVTDLPLRPALLPLAEPTALPDASAGDLLTSMQSVLAPSVVPSKVLLEERVVELPPEDLHACGGGGYSLSTSRRESAQSFISDYSNSECGGVRYVRTPSVVVSDYSDDVMCGITLEEIEYFRAHRMRRRRSSLETAGTERDGDAAHSDVSASSSCSNLFYCGSTISALDGNECFVNGARTTLPERKLSDCSTYSASGYDEEDAFTIPERPEEDVHIAQIGNDDLVDRLAAQHLAHTQYTKKVGMNEVGQELPDGKQVQLQ